MKLYKSLLYFTAALTAAGAMTGCSEEATLDGADAVYLEIQPTDISLCLGDTVRINSLVTNVNGDVIPTEVALSVDDETVAKILGDTAVVAVNGGQGRTTKLRAALINGKYAVTNVTVNKNVPQGIFAVADETAQDTIEVKRSWGVPHETVHFSINPIELLKDYSIEDGTVKVELDGLDPCPANIYDGPVTTMEEVKYKYYLKEGDNGYDPDEPKFIEKTYAIVTAHFTSPKVAGTGKVKLTVGEGGSALSKTVDVIMQPAFQFASFYGKTAGPDISSMPYLDGRPNLGTLTMYIANKCDKVIDINSSDEVRVAMNIEGGSEENILEAVKCYEWKLVKGGALLVTRNDYEIAPSNGFDAVLGVRSGVETGDVTFECVTPCRTTEDPDNDLVLTLNYSVVNIKKDYPIQSIDVPDDNISLDMGATQLINMTVTPAASYAYQKVTADAADPTIIEIMSFEGYDLPIRALKPGTTTITFSAYNDTQLVTKVMTVTVNDPVGRVVLDTTGGEQVVFAGATTTWTAKAYTISGALMSNVDFTWKSSNESIATVINGVIAAHAAGSATITASCNGVESGGIGITIREAPSAISSPSGFQGFYELDNDLVFLDGEEGQLVIAGGFADGQYEGTYNLSDSYYICGMNDAQAPATGTVTIAKGSGEYEYIVTMNVSVNISATTKVAFSFSNGIVEYLPE